MSQLLIFFISLSLQSATSHASALLVDVQAVGTPANDLIYEGLPIDENDAFRLKKAGKEIWRLNPKENLIWTNTSLPVTPPDLQYPEDGARVSFESFLESTPGQFRGSINFQDKPYTMTISLEHHATLLRAGLLRKLGFTTQTPRYYHSLTVEFRSVAARDLFLDDLSSDTLASRTRWIKDAPKDQPIAVLQGVTLEPGRMVLHPFHWGWMNANRLQGRRIMRSTIIPMLLGELNENINEFAWEEGQVFSNSIVLQALSADAYAEATYDDLRWMVFRLGLLQRRDFEEVVSISGLPQDISKLVLEKLIARRNHLVRLFELTSYVPQLVYNPKITVGNVKEGKLKRFNYPGYPSNFAGPDPQSPIRRSELFKFFKLSILSAGVDKMATEVNRSIPHQMASDVIKQHQESVARKMIKQQIVNKYMGPQNQQSTEEPIGFWGGPFGSFSLNANRSVSTGTYYGSDAPLQLVDSVGLSGSAGYFWGYNDPKIFKPGGVLPSLTATAGLSRNYIHIRPIQDVGKGLEANWADAIVSRFMPNLGEILQNEQVCDLEKNPIWVRQFTSDGLIYHEIMYDTDQEGSLRLAEEKKQELIKENIAPEQIIVRGVHGQEACTELVKNKTEHNLNEFLSKMEVGEAFIIADSLNISGNLSLSAPLSLLINQPADEHLNVQANTGVGFLVLRRTHFVRTKTGIQVYLQQLQSPEIEYGLSLNFYASVAGISQKHRAGYGKTRFYPIELEGIDHETRKKSIRAIRSLFVHNEPELIEEGFPHFDLDHEISARIINRSVISRHWDALREDHVVAILPPKEPGATFNPKDFERKLYLNRWVDRTGDNYLGFFGSMVSAVSKNRLNLFNQPAGTNPGATPFGRAEWAEITTEAEITPGAPFQPVTIMEDVWTGWSLSRKKLFRIFNEVEEKLTPLNLDRRLINRGTFNSIKDLQLYEIKSTLILYPKAVFKITDKIFSRKAVALNALFRLFGKDHCEVAITTKAKLIRGNILTCYSPSINKIMELRDELPSPTDKKARWINQVAVIIHKNAALDRLLELIEPDSYLLAVKVSGFKTNDEQGTSDYLSSTMGTFDPEKGSGLFRDFSNEYGISLYEMYAKYFSTGF